EAEHREQLLRAHCRRLFPLRGKCEKLSREPAAVAEGGAQDHVLAHRGVLEQLEVLEGAPDAERGELVHLPLQQILPAVADVPTRWPMYARDAVQQRRFARAV